MKRMVGGIAAAVTMVFLLGLVPSASAESQRAPQPHIVPSSWDLDFEHDTPKVFSLRLPTEEGVRHYWYMTYQVTNKTGDDQFFVPEVTLVTDAGDVLEGNRGISPRVIASILQRESNPLLERPIDVVGRLLQGDDNARESVVVWRMPEHNVRNARIFVAGLSGEIHAVEDPRTGETRRLRKTLMLEYDLPGSEEYMPRKQFHEAESPEWVVR